MTTARIRGIYATALTALLSESMEVVDASPAIRDRFEAVFPTAEPAVCVDTTADDQGVVIWGEASGVGAVRDRVTDQGIDTLSWTAHPPHEAVFVGTVTDTSGSTATIDLGETSGSLPLDAVDRYLETGETCRVQVAGPAPPWRDADHQLRTAITVEGVLASLERGVEATVAGTPTDAQALARTTDLLDLELPDRWGVRWHPPATDADMDALEGAIERLTRRAETVAEGLTADDATAQAPRSVAEPVSGAWVWFGRATRFEFDELRGTVLPTIPGHHRIKAGGRGASTAVDFVEELGVSLETFPTAAVFEQFGPAVGDEVAIRHGKPDGRSFSLGQASVTDRDPAEGTMTLKRTIQSSGTYDGLGTPRESGDVATTRIREGRWWYPTTYRSDDGTLRGTYVNVATPTEIFPHAVRYVDLHIDVVKTPDGTVEVVDAAELGEAEERGDVPSALADRAREVADGVADALGE